MADLIPEVAEVFQANQITVGHAVLIARLPRDQQQAVFDRAAAELVPAAAARITCSKRTGANTALFDDFQQDDKCMLSGI